MLNFNSIMSNITKVMNARGMMGQTGLKTLKQQIYTQAYLVIQVPFDPSFLTTLVTFDILD